MSLVSLEVPLRPLLRMLRCLERIASALERAYPDYTQKLPPPEPGLTIVTDEDVADEQVRAHLRARGFKPDDIDQMITDALNEEDPAIATQ